MSCRLPCSTINNGDPALSLPESVRSRVDWVRQHLQHDVVDGDFPDHSGLARIARQCRQADALLPEPQQNLSRASKLDHLGEH